VYRKRIIIAGRLVDIEIIAVDAAAVVEMHDWISLIQQSVDGSLLQW